MGTKIYSADQQFLIVTPAKDAGLNASGKVIQFDHYLVNCEQSGLSPVLVYAVISPSYSVAARYLVDSRAPISISEFLALAWSEPRKLGIPHRLEMKQSVLDADRGFVDWVKEAGVEVAPVGEVNAVTAFERKLQLVFDAARWFMTSGNEGVKPTLKDLNAAIVELAERVRYRSFGSSMANRTFRSWLDREKRFFDGQHLVDDWSPSDLKVIPRRLPAAQRLATTDTGEPTYVEGLKELAAMWPGGKRRFLQGLSISPRDFDFWMEGLAHPTRDEYWEVSQRANLQYDSYGPRLASGYLLFPATRRGLVKVWDLVSQGGDLEFAFEVLNPASAGGPNASAVRVIYFRGHCDNENIVFVETDATAATGLHERFLINLEAPAIATPEVWAALIEIYQDRANIQDPAAVVEAFAKAHKAWVSQVRPNAQVT